LNGRCGQIGQRVAIGVVTERRRSGRSSARGRSRPGRRRALVVIGVFALAAVLAAASFAAVSSGAGSSRHDVGSGAAPNVDPTPATDPPTTAAPPPTNLPPWPDRAPVVASGPRDRSSVALTFDSNLTDAMIQELNSGRVASFANVAVLDELDRLQVPATIFLAGKWMERYPDLTRRIAADPLFEVASHSYSHRAFHQPCYGLGTLPAAQMADDVRHSEALLRLFSTRATPYFRFPGGCYDDAALRAVAPTGVTVVQYDVASGDAFGTSVRAIVSNTLASTRNGSIIVMHITGGNTAPLTAQAVPFVVNGLRQRGFRLVKLSDLLAPAGG
jgi:peptidoglycan-N-acetylglucosamine deacetylase